MSVTVMINGVMAEITDGVWASDNPQIAEALQGATRGILIPAGYYTDSDLVIAEILSEKTVLEIVSFDQPLREQGVIY